MGAVCRRWRPVCDAPARPRTPESAGGGQRRLAGAGQAGGELGGVEHARTGSSERLDGPSQSDGGGRVGVACPSVAPAGGPMGATGQRAAAARPTGADGCCPGPQAVHTVTARCFPRRASRCRVGGGSPRISCTRRCAGCPSETGGYAQPPPRRGAAVGGPPRWRLDASRGSGSRGRGGRRRRPQPGRSSPGRRPNRCHRRPRTAG